MNRKAFFDAIRPAFGGSLEQAQVDGMNALLDAGEGLPMHHMANILAQVRRETGGYMAPIKETVMPHHKNKQPTDKEVIARLDRAFAAGKLKWVKTPYWRDGWFGRGQIQITHKANYAKFGITNPDDALRLDVSARVAVEGMTQGKFTGMQLSDYDFPKAIFDPPSRNPRRIVNGPDGSDGEVAKFHQQFAKALQFAGWGVKQEIRIPAPDWAKEADTEPQRPKRTSPIAALVAALLGAAAGLWAIIERAIQ